MTTEDLVLKIKCEKSFLFFARYMFKETYKRNLSVYPHVEKICEFMERVYSGEVKRGIVNMPPRYYKTEFIIKLFSAWAIAKNHQSKFIHLTYSDDLALDNSSATKEYIESEAFQRLWPMALKNDSKSKKKWFNSFGGGMYAASASGPITGFGAGIKDSPTFSGAILIDDPIKPEDANSETLRNKVNRRYNSTIRNRVNDPSNTPVIVVAQRLHEEDLPGFLLAGGSKEEWQHLNLPALDKDNRPLCPEIHSFDQLETLRQSDRYVFSGQYMQTPSPAEGGEWRRAWFGIVDRPAVPAGVIWNLYIDGAYTESTKNDPTGFQIAGRVPGGKDLYILCSVDKYLELPAFLKEVPKFIEAWQALIGITLIEPKASGKSMKQMLKDVTKLNVAEIDTPFVGYSKMERVRACSNYLEGGRVYLVKGSWNEAYLMQCAAFPNAKHDEHVDLTAYSIERELILGATTGRYDV